MTSQDRLIYFIILESLKPITIPSITERCNIMTFRVKESTAVALLAAFEHASE